MVKVAGQRFEVVQLLDMAVADVAPALWPSQMIEGSWSFSHFWAVK